MINQNVWRLQIPQLTEYCQQWQIRDLSVFGSAVRNELREDSDLDFLVTFQPNSQWDLFDMLHIKDGLAALFGRSVDLVDRRGLETSEN